MSYKDAFINQDGFLEWCDCDFAGNEVKCFWDGKIELHIKEPVCDCGSKLKYIGGRRYLWKCPNCSSVYDESYLLSPLVERYEDIYLGNTYHLSLDYGKWIKPEYLCEVGLNDNDYESFRLGLFNL